MASLICFMMQLAQSQLSQPPVWLQTPSALYFSTLRSARIIKLSGLPK